ncbi:hypothetical protein ACS0TY_008088 [Phlomoides rotata]
MNSCTRISRDLGITRLVSKFPLHEAAKARPEGLHLHQNPRDQTCTCGQPHGRRSIHKKSMGSLGLSHGDGQGQGIHLKSTRTQ